MLSEKRIKLPRFPIFKRRNRSLMRPLILEFAEMPDAVDHDWSKIHYSSELNLSVLAGTSLPAIDAVNSATETFTKADSEGSDSDKDVLNLETLMATTTDTRSTKEPTDSDSDIRSLQGMMATKTITESLESSDSDK
jgi:hypothetical protein